MPYTIRTKDGIEIPNIPDEVSPTSDQVRQMVMRARAKGTTAPDLNPGVQAANLINPAPPVKEEPKTTAAGIVGAANRGLLPYAVGAGLGAAIGAPIGGVGAVPGAVAGIGAVGLSKLVGDPIVGTINRLFGTTYTLPTDALEDLMTKLGLPEPRTQAERIVRTASEAAAGAGSQVALGQSLMRQGFSQTAQGVGKILSTQPGVQIAGGIGAGAASQAAAEVGMGPLGQLGVGLAGGAVAGKLASPRTITPPAPRTSELAAAERSGINVMTSDVKPPRTFAGKMAQGLGEKIPFAGTGGPRRAQQTQRIEAVRDVLRDFGAADAAVASDAVMSDLVAKRSADLTKYANLKGGVIKSLSATGKVPVTRTVKAINDQIKNMEKLKLEELHPVIEKMEGWKKAMRGQNLENLEMVRKQIGESFKDPSLASAKSTGEKALNAIYAPLREDMGDFIKANGKPSDYVKWAVANRRLSAMAGELKTGALKSVLKSGEATPEDVKRMLFSTKPSEVRKLSANLSAEGKNNAKIAVISKVADDIGGIENLSVAKFLSQVKKQGAPLGVFLNPQESERLKGLVRALELTAHADKASLVPATGVQAVPILAADLLSKTFGGPMGATAGAVGIGGVARLYESAPVRDILLKLPRMNPGSKEEAALFKRLTALMSSNVDQEE